VSPSITKTTPPAAVISSIIFSWRSVGCLPGAFVSTAQNNPRKQNNTSRLLIPYPLGTGMNL
jgi:hypothetical protein